MCFVLSHSVTQLWTFTFKPVPLVWFSLHSLVSLVQRRNTDVAVVSEFTPDSVHQSTPSFEGSGEILAIPFRAIQRIRNGLIMA